MSGFVIRSSELIKSQPNFPLTHVEIAFTGPSEGCTFKILRPFVQTSNEQPTPQKVHTVFVFLVRLLRMAASTSETAKIPL
ncbi:hypothetical protein D9M71_690570 [compost metagenome]